MGETLVIAPGEMNVEELLDALDDGRRIVVQTEFLGSEHEVTLRYDGETYYCDTPTRLYKHTSADGMRACLREQGYVRDEE